LDSKVRAEARETVSFDSESLILVDGQDRELGHKSKADCHTGGGTLHRAFSLFVFNPAGELLVQKRSAQKRLWPLYWSNSCCSHPRAGEAMADAVNRRLYQELHLISELQYLYKFEYHAQFDAGGAEHELCWVYLGASGDQVQVNRNEIAEWRFVAPAALDAEIAADPAAFTPWFKMEWTRIRRDHAGALAALTGGGG
jgi:isopentenyl-diphosphate delta-isomerase